MNPQATEIASFSPSMFSDECAQTIFFKLPHRKKSRGTISVQRGGHGIGPLGPSQRPG